MREGGQFICIFNDRIVLTPYKSQYALMYAHWSYSFPNNTTGFIQEHVKHILMKSHLLESGQW